ncbi:MAG: hypothetical protein KDB21_20590, partial [Acidimicrobiales bacterium]|nr:hypothetical protein [Acidimicrobiales bacterium]
LSQDNAQYTNRLTLTACHPKYSAAQRIIVVAELVNEPVVAVPRPGSVEPAAPTLASEDLTGNGAAADGADAGSSDAATDSSTDGEDTAPADGRDDGADDSDDPAAGAADGGDSGDGGAGDGSASDPVGTDEVAAGELVEDSFGEGLNGDSGAVLPSIVWALSAGMIWFTAWFVGRRWRKWPSYALGILPFLVVLFVCFVHVDQALPSY